MIGNGVWCGAVWRVRVGGMLIVCAHASLRGRCRTWAIPGQHMLDMCNLICGVRGVPGGPSARRPHPAVRRTRGSHHVLRLRRGEQRMPGVRRDGDEEAGPHGREGTYLWA